MKLQQYLKLKNKFEDKTFESKYGMLDKLLYYASFFGNAASIFFAFFFLSKLLIAAMGGFIGSGFIITVISIVFLTGFEFIKRFVLRNCGYSIFRNRSVTKEVIYNLIFSVILMTSSFYLSLNGAKIFADKSEKVAQQSTMEVSRNVDSLNLVFSDKIAYKIEERDGLIENRKLYSKRIEDATYTSRLKEYNELIRNANEEIRRADTEIARLREEKKNIITNIKSEVAVLSKIKINQIFKNQIAFILISSFIELLILVGIFFHCFFKLKSYKEFCDDTKNIDKYKLYNVYNILLTYIYSRSSKHILTNEDIKIKKIPNFDTGIRRKCGSSTINRFIEICQSLKIITMGVDGTTSMTFGDAKKALVNYFD